MKFIIKSVAMYINPMFTVYLIKVVLVETLVFVLMLINLFAGLPNTLLQNGKEVQKNKCDVIYGWSCKYETQASPLTLLLYFSGSQ